MENKVKRSYYEVLGVSEKASHAEIQDAYRQLAKKYHPDKNAGDAEAEERFKEIAEAYTALRDPGSRLLYDKTGQATKPPIENEIKGVLLGAFQQALIGDKEPILKYVRGFIQKQEHDLQRQKNQFIQQREKFETKRNKIRTKNKENLFSMLIEKELENIEMALNQINHNLQIAQGCYKLLDQYEEDIPKSSGYEHRISYRQKPENFLSTHDMRDIFSKIERDVANKFHIDFDKTKEG